MPLYNAERYLDEAFRSLLAQDFTDFEIVVCDNASTDSTWEICARYAAVDPRVRLYRNEVNQGASYNFNRVVELARGELFRWAAYDDRLAPTLLSRCVAALDAGGASVVLAFPQTMLIDENGVERGIHDDRLELTGAHAWHRVGRFVRRFNLCDPVYGVVRLDALRRTGLIRPYPSSDVTLLAELAAMGRFHKVAEPLFQRRIHARSSWRGQGSTQENLAALASWYDPKSRGSVRLPRLRLTLRTIEALLGNDSGLSGASRLACAASFAVRFGIRRARVVAGRVRRSMRPDLAIERRTVTRWPPACRSTGTRCSRSPS